MTHGLEPFFPAGYRGYRAPRFADALYKRGAFAAVSFLMTLDSLFDTDKVVTTAGYLTACTQIIEKTKNIKP